MRGELPGRVGILGMGMMGGSLGGALNSAPSAVTVVGFSPDPNDLEIALERGLIDEACETAESAIVGSDAVVLAVPLNAACSLVRSHSVQLKGRAITDVVSLKWPVIEVIREVGLESDYVGAHPLCGAAESGPGAALSDLFVDRTIFLAKSDASQVTSSVIETLWKTVGGRIEWIDPEVHDRLMVEVSHLPQIVANALASELQSKGRRVSSLGPGGRDMTRLAASSPDMWIDLFMAANQSLPSALRDLSSTLATIADQVETKDSEAIRRLMSRTRQWKADE